MKMTDAQQGLYAPWCMRWTYAIAPEPSMIPDRSVFLRASVCQAVSTAYVESPGLLPCCVLPYETDDFFTLRIPPPTKYQFVRPSLFLQQRFLAKT